MSGVSSLIAAPLLSLALALSAGGVTSLRAPFQPWVTGVSTSGVPAWATGQRLGNLAEGDLAAGLPGRVQPVPLPATGTEAGQGAAQAATQAAAAGPLVVEGWEGKARIAGKEARPVRQFTVSGAKGLEWRLLTKVDGRWKAVRHGVWTKAAGEVSLTLPASWRRAATSAWRLRFRDANGVTVWTSGNFRVTRTPVYKPVNCKKKKCVALTFDDGPGPYTDQILDTLRRYKVPATFFVLGSRVAAYPTQAAREVWDGHEVENHSWNHPALTGLSTAQIDSQIGRTTREIEKVTGAHPTLVRPPYGSENARVDGALKVDGYGIVRWSVDTRDWEHRNPARVLDHVRNDTQRGSIILMHDIQKASADALPKVIKALKNRGYTLVTVSTLLGKTKAGRVYSHG